VNYLKQINAFYDWLETNSMSASCISLWHALMAINNKAGWTKEFTVAISTLEAKTGLGRKTIVRCRNTLEQKGLIEWKARKGNQSAVYSLKTLYGKNDPQDVLQGKNDPQSVLRDVSQTVSQHVPQSVPINKLNETKQNNSNMPDITESERKMLSILANVKNYPFDYEKDLKYIRQLLVDFPTLDMHEQLKSWSTYKLDRPLEAKSNPRSQIRTWCQKAEQWGKGKKKTTMTSEERMMSAREREWAENEKQMDVLRARIRERQRENQKLANGG